MGWNWGVLRCKRGTRYDILVREEEEEETARVGRWGVFCR